jgi:1,2-dihydroxy-3-keto-5-methylthiopentene dioxygenase
MAIVTEVASGRVLDDAEAIGELLARHGMWYRRLAGIERLPAQATAEQVLAAFGAPIRELQSEGGYVKVDVIDVRPDTPDLAGMLARFNREHWHDEDEVRLIVGGSGVFHVRPKHGSVLRIEVRAGDMIKVPAYTWHWFDLCSDLTIRAVRLFQDPSGWTPHYTDSGEEQRHQPLCFGPRYMPFQRPGA